jgi:CDGSH-type Zn-finger protein
MSEPDDRPAQRWDDQWDDPAPADADAPVSITAYPNGPLLVRGPFEILTPTGEVIPPRRKTVALCRCGVSTLKPFCDGSHKAIGFRTEQEPPAPQPPLPA